MNTEYIEYKIRNDTLNFIFDIKYRYLISERSSTLIHSMWKYMYVYISQLTCDYKVSYQYYDLILIFNITLVTTQIIGIFLHHIINLFDAYQYLSNCEKSLSVYVL